MNVIINGTNAAQWRTGIRACGIAVGLVHGRPPPGVAAPAVK